MNISGNIGSRIGALELSDAVSVLYDGRLEEAGGVLQMGYTQVTACTFPTNVNCQRIDDAALETAAGTLHAGVSQDRPCPVMRTLPRTCGRIDDGALEDAAGSLYAGPGPTSSPAMCRSTIPAVLCRRIDDGALEKAVGAVGAGPTISDCYHCGHVTLGYRKHLPR